MSAPAPEPPNGKKQGLRKRLLRFFSRSDGNLKEKLRTRSEGDSKSQTAGEPRKGRSSWSERWARKDRQEPQEGAQSLPRLRNQKSEDAFLRRASRESKTRSLSYSELEFPGPSFLQRFGSLTWRKKRFHTFEYSNASPNISSPTELQWSVGRLERPVVGSELDLERRHPKSCIVQYPFAQSTPKIFEHCSKREQMNLEMSTSFDFIAADDGNNSPIPVSTKGKNVQLPFAFPERLEGEDEDSLPCWAESVLNDYMSQDKQTPGSPIYPLSGDSQTLEVIDQCEDPDQYRSPVYHRMLSKNLMLEESFIKESKVKNSLTPKKAQTKAYRSKKKEDTEIITKHIPCYNSILSQDAAQIKTDQTCVNLSPEESQNSSPSSQELLGLHTEFAKLGDNRTSLAHTSDITTYGLQKETKELHGPIEDRTQNQHREFLEHEIVQSLSDSSTVPISPPMKHDLKSQASPNTARMRFEVIITMTKEEKEQAQLQRLAQEMVKADELVGQDLGMSPSLESQASGCHRAGLTEVTAQDISETSEQTEKNTTQEEEIPEKKGGETPKGAQLDRSIGSAVDEKFLFTTSRSDWVAESCRLQLTKMDKTDNQQKSEFPRKPIEKNGSTKLSHGDVSPQLYVGHVKGLQKVFESISSKDDVIHHKVIPKSQQYGSLREKRHKVPQDAPVNPGVHGPVFSTVYNPVRKDHLKERSEQVRVTVTENTGKVNTSTVPLVSQSNMDSNRKKMESKGSIKTYIANVELTNICHSGYEDNYRKEKKQLPDLKLPPRTSTPPPLRTKNNSSISLSSPRGWKNENVIVRSPLASAHKFENHRNNSSRMPPQISHNFFFSEDNDLCAKIGLETNQNVKMYEGNPIHSRDLTIKDHHAKNSQESYKAELKLLPQVTVLHDVSHIVDGKEALHNRNFEKFANTKNNEIQKDSISNANLEPGEMQEEFTGTFLAERMLIDDTPYQETSTSEMVKSRGKEVDVDETMKKVDSKLSHEILPIITQRRNPPSFTHDASIKLEDTHREKHSNEFKNHNAPRFMDINYTKGDSKVMSHENRNKIAGDIHTSKEVKSKYQPTLIHNKIVNEGKHDSIHLNRRANDEIRHLEGSVSDQPLEETNTRLKYKVEELSKKHGALPHWDYSTKNHLKCNTNISLENQSTAVAQQNNPATDQSEEKVLFVTTEGKHSIHVEADIMRSANNEERKTDLADRVGGAINHLPINKAIAESYIVQTEMDIPEGENGVAWKKSVHKKEKDRIEEGSTIGYNYRNEKARKDKELINREQPDMISITAVDRQTDHMNEINEENREMGTLHALDISVQSEHEIAELRDQPNNIVRTISSMDEDRCKYEQNVWSSEVLSTKSDQALQMDLNLNVYRDVIDHGCKFALSVERERGQMENIWDIPKNTTVVKNIVNMIEEKSDEVDISMVDIIDQSILDATVTKHESASNTIYLFASDMTVNTEVEESNELMTDAEYNEEQAACEKFALVDSSAEISEQPCSNLKEDPDNMLSMGVNGSRLSKTCCENTAQADDFNVNHNLQNADLISEHHKNERQTLDVITQFLDNNVVEKIIVVSADDVSADDISICSEKDEDRNIKQFISEPVDQTRELVLYKAELTGSISATKECLTVDHYNSTMEDTLTLPMYEANQGHLSHVDDHQNSVDKQLVENINLAGEEKENEISQQANVKEVVEDPLSGILMGQVQKEAILSNDKCLIAKIEDTWYDENDALDLDVKKAKLLIMDISNEIHDPARFEIPNPVLSSTDIRDSTNNLPTENTQMSKLIANQITDEVNHWKIQSDNLSLKEGQAESLHELSTVALNSCDPQTTVTLHSSDPQTIETLHSEDPQSIVTLYSSDLQTTGTLHSSDVQTSGTLHTSDPQTTETLHSIDPQSIVTLHNSDLQPTGTLCSSDLQITGTLNTRHPQTSGILQTSDLQTTATFHTSDSQTNGTLNTRHPQSSETLHTSYLQTTGTLHSSDPQTTGTLHRSDLQTTGTLHTSDSQTTGTLHSSDPQTTETSHRSDLQTTGRLHSSDLQTTGILHSSDLQTTGTLHSSDPQTTGTLYSGDLQTTGTLHSGNLRTTETLQIGDPRTTGTLHIGDPWTTGTLHIGDPQTSGTLHGGDPQTNGTLHIGDSLTTGNLHSSNLLTAIQGNENELLESKNIDTHDSNIYVFLNKFNGEIPGILISDVEKIKNTVGNMSGLNTIYSQVQQNSVEQEQMTESVQHFYLPKSEKHTLDDARAQYGINAIKEEEIEALENMEIWVSKLRQFETPEFMKQLREPRQPRSSGLNMCGILPPIKEDQGSPKSDHFVFRLPIPDIKENKIISEESELTDEPNAAQQSETSEPGEQKYSWERNTERSAVRSSPLELMRKHSGDEVSRSDSYKNFIAQNISQRQSSIIGSLLLSERIDKKTDASEGKHYSRLESSFLLSSYLKPQNDDQSVTEETETVSENTSENDITTITINDTSTSTTEKSKQEESVDSTIPKMDHVANIDSDERPSKLELSVSSPLKIFPDVWHHPEKSHGKLNPRPGKIMLFSEPGFKGHVYEIFSDVGNMCNWELQGTISVRIIRGGWLLYEKPHFRGKRVMLSEGDTDLSCPWEIQHKSAENPEDTQKPKSWIGSLRHIVRDFQVPRISLFMDENGEGNKITILGATADSCVNGQPTKTESIIVHSGLWLVYSKPFFEGDPYILEPGGYPNRKAWNGHDSHLCSLQPARIGGPAVEKPNEPKILLFEHPEFKGHHWEVTKDLHLLQGEPNQHGERLTNVGSLKVFGGCWVAYEKESFHGHQYLLEEGEYQNWSQWGGCTEALGSLRHIRTDFSEPEIILYEKPGCLEGSCLRLNEALADIEVAQYGTNTCSVQVLNGVWVAYENVDFSGEQYILEKGIYHNYQDWGAKDSHISSVQPVLQVGGQNLQYLPKIQLFSEPNFHGDRVMHTEDLVLLPKTFSPQSCRIEGGSWILYENENCCGEQYILDEGDYPTRTAMGCQAISMVQSLKKVPLYFSTPSISLHGLERFEGKEIEFTSSVRSLQSEGYNNHVLSIKVASGIWVVYEHSDFRGRQWLLERTQITNWLLFSGIQRIGSLCPIRQRRVYFRLRNRALGLFLGVPEPAENMKAARVQVTEPRVRSCNLWYYEEGRVKNQMTPQMSLQVVGMATPGTKVVMWSEGRKPIQTWSLEDSGHIMSCLFEGLCLDVKGGHSYDSDHVVVWETAKDRLTQVWDLEVF
ncbi:beta/gamma crystallin domain-containing protein 2 isoform X2 [Ranitomeya variabilis]|uniref:beta/gamma crystallin domain-containing protein 2 isoform X2 n=1 Tax=Ranitomeya variabilis TaxID=490064 RepID=UPI0040565AB2